MIDDVFCSCITKNWYFKLFAMTVLSLALTFVDDIDILHKRSTVFVILSVLILMSFYYLEELGTVILLLILFVITYNIMVMRLKNNDEKKNNITMHLH